MTHRAKTNNTIIKTNVSEDQNHLGKKLASVPVVKKHNSGRKYKINNERSKIKIQSNEVEGGNSYENNTSNVYFSLNHIPDKNDSPLMNKNFISFSSNINQNKELGTIKRNLIFLKVQERKKRDLTNSMKNSSNKKDDQKNEKSICFKNHQNEILSDVAFYEEGLKKSNTYWYSVKKIWGKIKKHFLYPFSENFNPIKFCSLLVSKFRREKCKFFFDFFRLFLFYSCFITILIELTFLTKSTYFLTYLYDFTLLWNFVIFLTKFWKEVFIKKKKLNKILVLESVSVIFLILYIMSFGKNSNIIFGLGFLISEVPFALKFIKSLTSSIAKNYNRKILFSFTIIFIKICTITHVFSCIWIYIGLNFKENNNNWLVMNQSKVDISLYFRCFSVFFSNFTYFGLNLTSNLMTPVSLLDIICLNFMISCGFLFFLYNLKVLKDLFFLEDLDSKKTMESYEKSLKSFKLTHTDRIDLSNEMSMILNQYNNYKNFPEILKIMPIGSQEKLLMKTYFPIIEKIPVLSKNFSKNFLKKILLKFKLTRFSPDEILFKVKSF